MRIYKNKWSSIKRYFVETDSDSVYTYGIEIIFWCDKWSVKRGKYYNESLSDNVHFPCVGNVNLNEIIISSILNNIDDGENKQ